MKQKSISVEELRAYCKEHGIPMTPKDDPVYNEGPSIVFLNRSAKRFGNQDHVDSDASGQKGTC